MKKWNLFVQSKTSKSYEENLEDVMKVARTHEIWDYLEKTWIHRAPRFVALFTSQNPHFGNSSTSRVEGGHHRLKGFLDGSNNDFITCFKAFKRAGDTQYKDIMITTGIESKKTLLGLPLFFQELNGVVSHFALKKIKTQFNRIPKAIGENCTKTFRGAWGMPCAHELALELEGHDYISPKLVHEQWLLSLDRAPASLDDLKDSMLLKVHELNRLPKQPLRKIYEDLAKLQSGRYAVIPISDSIVKMHNRGRPRHLKRPHLSQTAKDGRWKSQMEIDDAEEAQTQTKKARLLTKPSCSYCSQSGHNRQTCPDRLFEEAIEDCDLFDLEEGIAEKLVPPQTSNSIRAGSEKKEHPVKPPSLPDIAHPPTKTQTKRTYRCSIRKLANHRADRCPNKTIEALDTSSSAVGFKNADASTNLLQRFDAEMNRFELDDAEFDSNDIECAGEASWSVGSVCEERAQPQLEQPDQVLCAFCDDPMPSEPSRKLLKLRDLLFSLPNITKRVERDNPLAMYLPVSLLNDVHIINLQRLAHFFSNAVRPNCRVLFPT